MKVRPNILCDKCNLPDFIEHFFVECDLIKGFWDYISCYIESSINIKVKLSTKEILLGLTYTDYEHIKNKDINYINAIILLGKLCISKLRYGQIKSIYLIFDLELNLRSRTLKHNYVHTTSLSY